MEETRKSKYTYTLQIIEKEVVEKETVGRKGQREGDRERKRKRKREKKRKRKKEKGGERQCGAILSAGRRTEIGNNNAAFLHDYLRNFVHSNLSINRNQWGGNGERRRFILSSIP